MAPTYHPLWDGDYWHIFHFSNTKLRGHQTLCKHFFAWIETTYTTFVRIWWINTFQICFCSGAVHAGTYCVEHFREKVIFLRNWPYSYQNILNRHAWFPCLDYFMRTNILLSVLERINNLGGIIIFATRWHQLIILSEMTILLHYIPCFQFLIMRITNTVQQHSFFYWNYRTYVNTFRIWSSACWELLCSSFLRKGDFLKHWPYEWFSSLSAFMTTN